jgi:hypothetical protein
MISYENGRFRSSRPVDEARKLIEAEVKGLTEEEKGALELLIQELVGQQKQDLLDAAERLEWDPDTGPPIPISQWVNDEYYLGETARTLWPRLKEDMVEFFEGDYAECILCLHPDTRIPLLDGATPTISELASRWEVSQEPFWLYGIEDGRVVPARGQAPRQTGVDDYFKVALDDGTSFTGNSRHQMIMCDGSKRMIRDMDVGDKISSFESWTKPVGSRAVVSIEQEGRGPVYCMTVPRTTNFAISTGYGEKADPTDRSGVFSSNTGSTRWGKDYFSTTALIRVIYELYCLKRPTDTLGLGRGEIIHIVPISHTKEAAQRVVFQGIVRKLSLTPFWKGRFEVTKEEIRFPGKDIIIIAGGSNENAALGLNVWAALMDEGNFFAKQKKGHQSAGGQKEDKSESIYDSLRRRIRGTYAAKGLRGRLFMISSKKSIHDFTERRLREAVADNGPSVFVRDYSKGRALSRDRNGGGPQFPRRSAVFGFWKMVKSQRITRSGSSFLMSITRSSSTTPQARPEILPVSPLSHSDLSSRTEKLSRRCKSQLADTHSISTSGSPVGRSRRSGKT